MTENKLLKRLWWTTASDPLLMFLAGVSAGLLVACILFLVMWWQSI